MTSVIIGTQVITTMIEDAIGSFPDECCGFLFGNESTGERIIQKAMPVDNAKIGDRRRRFEIKPVDYMKAERFADKNGLQLLGVYHSHPGHPAVPSEHDRVAAQPYFSYVILSVIDKYYAGMRSWRLNDEQQFEEEKIFDHQYI